jgi:CRP-like cAMP-binding protein
MTSVKAVFKSGPGGGGKNPYEKFLVHHLMGEIIFSEGDIGTDMYIVQSGTVELLKAIGGETRVLSTLEKGDFFGEMSVSRTCPAPRPRARRPTSSCCASTARPSTRCSRATPRSRSG